MSNTNGYVGEYFGSNGTVTVTGTDSAGNASSWDNSDELIVGKFGTGTLRVEAGGSVSNTKSFVGRPATGPGARGTAKITGANSIWNNSSYFYVGRYGEGTVRIENGGRVENTRGYIGSEARGDGTATITGANSIWDNPSYFYVGRYGEGVVTIENGGRVENTNGYIGIYPGASGTVTVAGTDSTWDNDGDLHVGGWSTYRGTANISVQNGGELSATRDTKLYSGSTINLDGGILDIGTLDLTEGTFNILDGYLHADHVIGNLNNQGGTLAPGNSPGILTVTDDYTQGAAATLKIELGGTVRGDEYDALIVSGNLTLDGSLDVLSIDGYVSPVVRGESDDFVLVLASSRANHFTNVTYDSAALSADFGPDGSGSFRDHVGNGQFRNVTHTPTEVQFRNLLALHGNADGNRAVDITDFEQFLVGFTGPTSDWTTGDFNLDNVVDITDFSINLLPSFAATDGGTYGPGQAIPEPSTLLLFGLGGLLLAYLCGCGTRKT